MLTVITVYLNEECFLFISLMWILFVSYLQITNVKDQNSYKNKNEASYILSLCFDIFFKNKQQLVAFVTKSTIISFFVPGRWHSFSLNPSLSPNIFHSVVESSLYSWNYFQFFVILRAFKCISFYNFLIFDNQKSIKKNEG